MHADDVYLFVLFVAAISDDDDDWRLVNRAFSDDDADSKKSSCSD